MTPKAKTIRTPVGTLRAPLDPSFTGRLSECETEEDLFALVDRVPGFICPDAFNEVMARGLYGAYQEWRKQQRGS